MAKLIIMRGLPGSGKSTRAEELVKADGNCIRLNKDLLQEMLHFDKWTGKRRALTKEAERVLAEHFLAQGRTVIVDDTNLDDGLVQSWKELAINSGHKVQIEDINTPWEECIERDESRGLFGGRCVGFDVIINMARKHGRYKYNKREIICDIDGTLCKIDHRLNYIKGDGKKDWHAFFKNIPNDVPRPEIIEKVNEYAKTHTVVLVSGRPDTYKKDTLEWLRNNKVIFQTIIMRRGDDSREDDIVKKEILDAYFDKNNIDLVIDDRPRVIRMWQAEGLKVWDVGPGIEF